MNEQERQEYLEQYKKEKEKGLPFFPDILFKDAVVSLVIFIVQLKSILIKDERLVWI